MKTNYILKNSTHFKDKTEEYKEAFPAFSSYFRLYQDESRCLWGYTLTHPARTLYRKIGEILL